MLSKLKDRIKKHPRIYDFFNTKRTLDGDLEKWLNVFSKSSEGAVHFIQVGASDGLRWDPLRKFIIRDKWKGVFIEPLPPVFKLLKENYRHVDPDRFTFINRVISSNPDDVGFWTFSEAFLDRLSLEEKMYYLRKSSLKREQVHKALKEQGFSEVDIKDKISCYTVASTTLSLVISDYFSNQKLDLVFIDAEGYDDYVIKTINFEKNKPTALVYESHSLGDRKPDIEEFLKIKGYEIIEMNGDSVAYLSSRRS